MIALVMLASIAWGLANVSLILLSAQGAQCDLHDGAADDRQPHRLPAARHVLQPAHRRLRAQVPDLAQQQGAAVRGLAGASKIDCKHLAANGWRIERKRRSCGHGGVAVSSGRKALV